MSRRRDAASDGEFTPLLLGDDIELDETYASNNSSLLQLGSTGTSTVKEVVANFVNSIIGAGILGIPYALNLGGFGMGLLLLVVVALLCDYSLHLLIKCSIKTGAVTYVDLMEACVPKVGGIAASVFLLLFEFGAAVAYLVIVSDTVPAVLAVYFPDSAFASSKLWITVLVTVVFMLPLSSLRDITHLAKTSALSVLSVFLILGIVLYTLCVEGVATSHGDEDKHVEGVFDDAAPFAFAHSRLVAAIGVEAFAFVMHDASFLLYHSLKRPTLAKWHVVSHVSIGTALLCSMLMGVSGYLVFTTQVEGNILNNYNADSGVANVARLAFAVTMVFTFPIAVFIGRDALVGATVSCLRLYHGEPPGRTTTAVSRGSGNRSGWSEQDSERDDGERDCERDDGERGHRRESNGVGVGVEGEGGGLGGRNQTPLLGGGDSSEHSGTDDGGAPLTGVPSERVELSLPVHLTVSWVMVAMALGVALAVGDLGAVLELTGGFCGVCLAFVFPAVAYIRVYTPTRVGEWAAVAGLLVFGLAVMVISTTMTIITVFDASSSSS